MHLCDIMLGKPENAGVAHSCWEPLLAGCGATSKHHLIQDVCGCGWQYGDSTMAQEYCSTATLQCT